MESGRWHVWQLRCRIGEMSLLNVTWPCAAVCAATGTATATADITRKARLRRLEPDLNTSNIPHLHQLSSAQQPVSLPLVTNEHSTSRTVLGPLGQRDASATHSRRSCER